MLKLKRRKKLSSILVEIKIKKGRIQDQMEKQKFVNEIIIQVVTAVIIQMILYGIIF